MTFILDDNPTLSPKVKNRLKATYHGVSYTRNILGLPADAEGLIYPNRPTIDQRPPRSEVVNWRVGLDHARSGKLAAVLVAGLESGKRVIWDEFTKVLQDDKDSSSNTSGDLIVEFVKKHGLSPKKLLVRGDPRSAISFKEAMLDRGFTWQDAKAYTPDDIKQGCLHVSDRLSSKDLVIYKECTQLLDEMAEYPWDPKFAGTEKERPLKDEKNRYDLCDATRYSEYGENYVFGVIGSTGF